MRDAEDTWFDELAGRGPDGDVGDGDADARAIRAAILARQAADATALAAEDPAREEQLIERARAEGLLTPRRSMGWSGAVTRNPRRALWLSAAALACVVVGLTFQLRLQTPAPVTRGSPVGIVHIRAADPLQLKQDLIRELKAAGVNAHGYESLGGQGIDADLPVPLTAPVQAVLDRHHLAAPPDGVLELEIEPETP